MKKQADIWIVVDISGSMKDEDKIGQAKKAALAFLDKVEPQNRVGLIAFNSNLTTLVDLDILENNKATLKQKINDLNADGGTALYDAIATAIEKFSNEKSNLSDRIRAVVLLTDGADTASQKNKLNDLLRQITATHEDQNPIIVIPIAYGSTADVGTLGAIARASTTKVQSGDPKNIGSILQIISSFF